MSELRLKIVENDVAFGSCGVESIDELTKDAYVKTLLKQAVAYDILVDGIAVGGCMIKFVTICDEEYCAGDPMYAALEITYIAIDKRFQRRRIGSQVLSMLILRARDLAKSWPIRFLIIEALRDKERWYVDAGFKEYPRKEDTRYPDTIPMRMDFIDKDAVERYAELQC